MSDNLAAQLVQPGIDDAHARAVITVLERFEALPLEVVLVYLIDSVDASALPHLVEQFDMGDFVRETTSEAATRVILKEAINLKRHLGTRWAVSYVTEAIGAKVTVLDWYRQAPAGDPHTFIARAWVNDATVPLSAEIQAEAHRLVRAAKRWSQHESFEIGMLFRDPLVTGSGGEVAGALRIEAGLHGRNLALAQSTGHGGSVAEVRNQAGALVGRRQLTSPQSGAVGGASGTHLDANSSLFTLRYLQIPQVPA